MYFVVNRPYFQMPTLIKVNVLDNSSGDGRNASARAFHPNPSGQQYGQSQQLDGANNDTMNATTLSDTMLEDALHAMRIDQQEAPSRSETATSPGNILHQDVDPDASTLTESHIFDRDLAQKPAPFEATASPIPTQKHTLHRRVMGPNEAQYRETFEHKVRHWIDEGRSRFPDAFRDYRSMTVEEQRREQDRVVKLLVRLQILSSTCSDETDKLHQTQGPLEKSVWFSDEPNVELYNDENGGSSEGKASPMESDVTDYAGEDSVESVRDASALLFSPPPTHIHQKAATPASVRFAKKIAVAEHSDDSSSNISIEEPRAASQFHSPAAVQRKRMASVSGKRGADHARMRMGDCLHESKLSQERYSQSNPVDTPGDMIESPPRGMSLTKRSFFSPDQSPIPLYLTHSPTHAPQHSASESDSESETQVDIPLGGDSDEQSPGCEFSRDSLIETRYERQPLRDTNRHNLRMKKGAVFHYNPLETASLKSVGSGKLRDPFADYSGAVSQRLNHVYERLLRRDQKAGALSRAILLSMNHRQILSMTLKLVGSETPVNASRQSSRSDQLPASVLEGRNLVVVREREAIAAWSAIFREETSFSVLDYFTLPVKQRKSQATAHKLTNYDVVITTFDALKSSDITFSVDLNGRVNLESQSAGHEQGWYASRGASQGSGQTKQFSVLHSLTWLRVIFVDLIGRKGYVTKPDTSRSLAASALNGQRRYIFFPEFSEDENENDGGGTFLYTDRKNSASLESVLWLNEEDQVYSVRQVIIDVHKKAANRK